MFKALFILGSILLSVGVWTLILNGSKYNFVSPTSKVYGTNTEVKVINDWFPKTISKTLANKTAPDTTARSGILVNFDTAETLFAREEKLRLPAASTIKIMTALLVLEKYKTSDLFTVSENATRTGEDSMGLSIGEKLTVKELLYGLMLPSGNDAAVAIAENVVGTEDAFVTQMNDKAKALGMKDTKFINASGLDVDEEKQYTTAYDLAVLAHYIWKNYPVFREITSTDYIFIEYTNTHKAYELYNDTNLLTTYPGVKGIKPGFTWEAGYCLVTYAENDGKKLIGVLLGSANRRMEMKELLDYGFGHYGISVEHPALDY